MRRAHAYAPAAARAALRINVWKCLAGSGHGFQRLREGLCLRMTSVLVHRFPVCKALDLNRIAAGVGKEHGPLLAGLTLKANLWRQNELGVGCLQALGQCQPVGLEQNHAQVGHGHHVVADLAGVGHGKGLAQVQGDLVTEEVEVDPGVGAAAFAAAEDAAVEAAGFVQVGDVIGEMKQALHSACKRSIACFRFSAISVQTGP